jgi:hypothetical protein
MNIKKAIGVLPILVVAAAMIGGSGATLAGDRDRDDRRHARGDKHKSQLVHRDDSRGRHGQRHDKRAHGCFECRVERRLDRQARRIQKGVRSGDLTHWEAKRLRRQHRGIERLERRFTNDGRLSREERKRLERALDRSSDRIAHARHNDLYRRSHGYRHHYDGGYRGKAWYFGMR